MHPTVKPVSLVADAIRDCSKQGDIVLDPFCGSGTILIAAERTGRKARALEIDPGYVDVAIRRWEELTGKSATLSTGETFEEVTEQRGPVARLVGIKGGVVSGVFNLESSSVEALDWRPRHDEQYDEA